MNTKLIMALAAMLLAVIGVRLALTKTVLNNRQLPVIFSILAGCFVVLACVFGVIVSRHPNTK